MLRAPCRRISVRMASALWSALIQSVRPSPMMWLLRAALRWFCVTSAPGSTSNP